jgi:hypothetical protein
VAKACPGADREALLDELVASESVEVVQGTTVRCLSRAYLPQETDVKRIEWMGRVLSNVAASFVHNLLRLASEPIYFERAVVADNPISEVGRDRFLALAGERGQELLTELDTFLARLPPAEQNESVRKYGVGIYFFEDQPTNAPADMQVAKTYEEASNRVASQPIEIDVLAGVTQRNKRP